MKTIESHGLVIARAAVARAAKLHGKDSEEFASARSAYRLAIVADRIESAAREIAALAPEFSPEQRARLAGLLSELRIPVSGGETR